MADTKISALTAATTPLAGTEVLPIVQSGTTKKVSVNDLTTGKPVSMTKLTANIPSGTTYHELVADGLLNYGASGYLTGSFTAATVAGAPGVYIGYNSSTKSGIVGPSAVGGAPNQGLEIWAYDNATAFKQVATVSAVTAKAGLTLDIGNLIIGTSGNGIDFSATPGTGTSELFNDYEEGTWTPVLTGGTTNPTYTVSASETGGRYTKIGNIVYFSFEVRWSAVSGGSGDVIITGLPFTRVNNQQPGSDNFSLQSRGNTYLGDTLQGNINANQTAIYVLTNDAAGGATINLQCLGLGVSGVGFLRGSGFYIASV
jgi:hypothetical protein